MGTYFASILRCASAFVEGIFAAAAADFDSREGNIGALEIECHAGAAGGGEDAAPVGIGAGEGGFYERRIRNGERDLLCSAIGGRAANFDFDHVPGAFAIGDDLQGERLADELQRGAEFFPIVVCVRDFRRAGCAVGKQRDGVVRGGVAIHGDGVEGSLDDGAQRAGEQRGGNGGVGGEKAEHGGHVGMNHSRAFGAAEDTNLFAADAAFCGGPFGARVRGHDGAGKFREGAGIARWRARTRRGIAFTIFCQRSGAPMTPVEQTRICDGCRRPSSRASFSAVVAAAAKAFRAGAAIGVAGIDDHAAHAVRAIAADAIARRSRARPSRGWW